MIRVGLVLSKRSYWVSISKIEKLLKKELIHFFKKESETSVYVYQYDTGPGDLLLLAQKIKADKITKLVFVADSPCPAYLLNLISVNTLHVECRYYIFIYGSFINKAREWCNCFKNIIGCNITLIAPSVAHGKLIEFFLKKDKVKILPFPVDSSFNYKSKSREQLRRKLGFLKDDFIFIYSGRVSLQKNIHHLCKTICNIKAIGKKKLKLLIVGDCDDQGAEHVGISYRAGFFYHEIMSFVKTLSEGQDTIKFLGHVDSNILNELLNASDCFINLSLLATESYGLGVQEALLTGMPIIITDWGGLKRFQVNTDYCNLVDLKLNRNSIWIDDACLMRVIKKVVKNPIDINERKKIAAYNKKLLNKDWNMENMKKLFMEDDKKKFAGSNKLLRKYIDESQRRYFTLNERDIFRDVMNNYC